MSPISAEAIAAARSFLFVPGSRPSRFEKAAATGADVVILDLEDSVSAEEKDAARHNAHDWLSVGNAAIVRINAVGTEWHEADVLMAAECGSALMIPKAENTERMAALAASASKCPLIPLIETASGVMAVQHVAAMQNVVRLAFGSIDFALQLGIDPADREALLAARTALVLASAAAKLPSPIDGVTTAVADPILLSDDMIYARRLGMRAKLCIHPSQVARVHAALAPTPAEVQWATRVVSASRAGQSAVAVDGQMVDTPVVRRAERILAEVDCTGG